MSPTKADVENTLVAQPDVAAGLVNAVFARGAAFASPTELEDAPLSGTYESAVGLRGTMRDVAKYFIRDEKLECIFAFEVQSSPHPFMPARVLGYDGITYRDQLENQTLRERFQIGVNRIAPVFTIILYVGAEQWRKTRKLSDRATMSQDVAPVLAPYFDDYEIRVVDLAGMSDEELKKFPNDIRIIAEYFRAVRNKTEYKPSRIKIIHKRELFYFMEHVVNDLSFAYDVIMQGYKREPEDMCEVLDRIKIKEREEGREEGRLETLKESAANMRAEGLSDDKIALFLKVDVADVKIWLDSQN